MIPDGTYNTFIGNIAYTPLTSSSEATFNTFTGNIIYNPLNSSSEATFNTFTGNIIYNPLNSSPEATYNLFICPLEAPAYVTGSGIMLYPISEDPNQRPALRY